jgi:hypothetical protein
MTFDELLTTLRPYLGATDRPIHERLPEALPELADELDAMACFELTERIRTIDESARAAGEYEGRFYLRPFTKARSGRFAGAAAHAREELERWLRHRLPRFDAWVRSAAPAELDRRLGDVAPPDWF